MDSDSSQPGTPAGGPLQAVAPERVNQQRDSPGSVHDKISQFNNMSIAMQTKALERKTADAALKRAMLGREEAEMELRKYKEELRGLRKAVEEGKERERRVGERLEAVMENYGRAKETHAHTQTLWEKEIRRARKETFKTQSTNVKLQEELKTARSAVKILEDGIEKEKGRSRVREQEAFEARYQIVGVQQELEQALARIKVVEQERDAFKTAAKNEEVARIAAEGRLPLPPAQEPTDEFASPPKKSQKKRKISSKEPRYSLSTMEIESSVATEMEIDELNSQVRWERQRADRALDMVEFLKAECEMRCCPCGRPKPKASPVPSPRRTEQAPVGHPEPASEHETTQSPVDSADMGAEASPQEDSRSPPDSTERVSHETAPSPPEARQEFEPELAPPRSKKGPRRSTIFCPKEGIFRTVSEQEAEALQAREEAEVIVPNVSITEEPEQPPAAEATADGEQEVHARMYARTPSVEPPSFAMPGQGRTSLLSLLNAPHGDAHESHTPRASAVHDSGEDCVGEDCAEEQQEGEEQQQQQHPYELDPRESPEPRPHTSATLYQTVTTTIPVHDENILRSSSSSFSAKLRTPSRDSELSFDATNPALTPTMTREQALAKIRERRGRARSAANGTATPHKKMLQGKDRRDMSAPTGKMSGGTH